jgi:hypothetical protein
MDESTLTVTCDGIAFVATSAGDFRFGRGPDNDLQIAGDRSMHRQQGRFTFSGGQWWLQNVGGSTPLHIRDRSSSSSVLLAPGQSIGLGFNETVVAFTTSAQRSYQLLVQHDAARPEPVASPVRGTLTQTHVVPLGNDHLLLVLALAEPLLRDPAGPRVMPTNRQVAHRFGWKLSAYTSKLDKICTKFARAGVEGLRGGDAIVASDRRDRLVSHLISHQLITVQDLSLLEAYPPQSG